MVVWRVSLKEEALFRVGWCEQLTVGAEMAGPAVIEQADATTLVWPEWTAVLDEAGNVMLEKRS